MSSSSSKQMRSACTACYQRKVRCPPDPNTPSGPCLSCQAADRPCEYLPNRRPGRPPNHTRYGSSAAAAATAVTNTATTTTAAAAAAAAVDVQQPTQQSRQQWQKPDADQDSELQPRFPRQQQRQHPHQKHARTTASPASSTFFDASSISWDGLDDWHGIENGTYEHRLSYTSDLVDMPHVRDSLSNPSSAGPAQLPISSSDVAAATAAATTMLDPRHAGAALDFDAMSDLGPLLKGHADVDDADDPSPTAGSSSSPSSKSSIALDTSWLVQNPLSSVQKNPDPPSFDAIIGACGHLRSTQLQLEMQLNALPCQGDRSLNSFREPVMTIEKASRLITELADASMQQRNGASQVNEALLAITTAMAHQLLDTIALMVTKSATNVFWATRLLLLRRLGYCLSELRLGLVLLGHSRGDVSVQAQTIVARVGTLQSALHHAESTLCQGEEGFADSLGPVVSQKV